MISFPSALLACALTGVLGAGPFDGYRRLDVERGVVLSRGWSEAEASWAAEFLERSLSRVESRLRRRVERPVTMVLTGSHQEMARVTTALGAASPGFTVQGLALPSRAIIIIRRDLVDLSVPGDPTSVTIEHELAHIVLHRRRGTNIPRWLDEGVAVWVSQGRLSPKQEAYLSLLARTGSLYRLTTLERSFPAGHLPTTVAYQQSFLVVRFLAERWGADAVAALVDRLEDGEAAFSALAVVTGLSTERFEEEFSTYVAGLHSVVVSLLALLNVWTLTALLALVAIARFVLRRRRTLRRMAEEEAAADESLP